jgi:tRNA nucleotidyltransferase (CCA-adding enzyme)
LTAGLIENAVKMDFFRLVSGRRVFAELHQILEEENPAAAIIRLNEYNLLNVIHPSITLNKELISLFDSVKKVLSWHDLLFLEESYMKWTVYFLSLTGHCDKKTIEEICNRIELAPRYKTIFCKERFEANKCLLWMERNLPIKNSILYHRLSVFQTELALYMMAATKHESVKRSISNYFTKLRHIGTSIKGRDLLKMGLEPGPIYRKVLKAVHDAKLNGELKTRNDELVFVKDYVR